MATPTPPTSTEPEVEPSPFGSRWFKASALFMGALLLGLLFLGFRIWFSPDEGQTPDPGPARAERVCDAPASDQTEIVGTPAHGWKLTGAGGVPVAVPSEDRIGPGVSDGGIHSCYAHSPEGAVFAATNMLALGSTGQEMTLYRDFTVDGETRDQMMAGAPTRGASNSAELKFTGFRLVDYTKDTATVSVVAESKDVMAAFTIDLVWSGEDWLLDPPSSMDIPVAQITDMDGYNQFQDREGDTNG